MMRSIKDLRKEYPKEKFILIRRNKPLKNIHSYTNGVYMIAVYSPNTKGAKQPVEYYRYK